VRIRLRSLLSLKADQSCSSPAIVGTDLIADTFRFACFATASPWESLPAKTDTSASIHPC